MKEEKIITGLTIVVMGAIIAVVVGIILGVSWRFIIQPLFYGGCGQ